MADNGAVIVRGHARTKVLFDSNHPFWPASDCLVGLVDLELDEPTTRAFLHDDAARVFGLQGPSRSWTPHHPDCC